MTSVLLDHVAADDDAARRLAAVLDAAGFDVAAGRPGDLDRDAARARCDVLVLLASPAALESDELTPGVIGAAGRGVPIVPVLAGVGHVDLATRQPAWRAAIGSATAIEVPPEGVDAIGPRLVEGVRSVAATLAVGRGRTAGARGARRTVLVAGGVAVVLAIAAGAWWAVARDDSGGDSGPDTGPTTSASTSTSPTGAASTTTEPVADSTTTAVKSVAGNLRIVRVQLVEKFCAGPTDQDCAVAPSGARLVVLRVSGWDGQPLPYTEELAHQMDQALVRSGTHSAGFTKAKQSTDQNSWDIAYVPVPASATAADLLLRWPGNPTLLLHPAGG
jgi:hypothetical protein